MQHQSTLALGALDGNKAQVGSRHRLADRFRIGRIILLPFHVGLHIGGRDEPHIMTQRADLASPEVRRRACLQTDPTGWKITEKIQNGGPAKLPAKDDLAVSVNTVKLEDRLGQIDPDGCNILCRTAPSIGWFLTASRWHIAMPQVGAVHTIKTIDRNHRFPPFPVWEGHKNISAKVLSLPDRHKTPQPRHLQLNRPN